MSTTGQTQIEVSPEFDAECAIDAATHVFSPFVVLVDSREQFPYGFSGMRSDKVDGSRIIQVRTETRGLKCGDYSLEIDGVDYSDRISIERKSLGDLYGTVGGGRANTAGDHATVGGGGGNMAEDV